MGTHCYIAKQVGPDQYRTIYCHLDGYDRFGVRRNTTCRGCPFDGQCTTCLED